ncbi:hypothetical protein HDF16_005677 [Granulicella aggregans]|uniref:Uncharacterized protein n=1 Tax=Granulicella aggregans TaxID=474949 RepID=A0A7W7ZKL5_9BACT|nr:hypothetical protein [Granulicella aggregans]
MPRRAIAWLVLAPEWPEEIVRLGFPVVDRVGFGIESSSWTSSLGTGDEPVEMLRRAPKAATDTPAPAHNGFREMLRRAAGVTADVPAAAQSEVRKVSRPARPIVQASTALTPWEGDTFRLSPELRLAALEDLLTERDNDLGSEESGLAYVRTQLTHAALAMLASDKLPDYPTLWRWAQLARRAASDDDLRAFLDDQVKAAISEAEARKETAVPEVLRWIEAAEFFTDIFQGKLELALTLARRRRELFNRRAYDRRKLDNYLPREAQIEAFRDLLHDPHHWALHFVGNGGMGKTMLLRYLTDMASKPTNDGLGIPIVTSRVDFDFLNPDYPFRAPGLLLSALATELRLQAGNEATSIFTSFDHSIARLHDEATRRPGAMRLLPLEHPLFSDAINDFASACQVLAFDPATSMPRCVVLMLDTCEELAKLRPDGTVPENVRVTFEVLERLTSLANSVRVVFSGRRELATSGYKWKLKVTPSESSLSARDYLRLFVVQGFDDDEARHLLEAYQIDGKPVPAAFRDPILARTRSTEDAEYRRFTVAGQAAADAELSSGRHNPYDLDMYAEWAVKNSKLSVDQLRNADSHFYVEERIVLRLNKELLKLLPQLALLGRFDRPLLVAITQVDQNAAQLREEVIAQEWVRGDRATAIDMWLIEPRLRQRILAYYNDREAAALVASRRSLADTLTAMTLCRPFEELTVQYFSAAFDALRDDPERATAWWSEVENRLLAENAWPSWGQDLTSHLLAEPAFSSDLQTSFRAAVLATEASVIVHAGGDAGTIWQRAEAALPAHPAQTGRARLAFRIQCGTRILFRQVPSLGDMIEDEQCRASWLAAVETLTERVERDGTPSERLPYGTLYLLHNDSDPYLKSFAKSLTARLEFSASKGGVKRPDRSQGTPQEIARSRFREAVQAADGVPKRQSWLDWRAPDNLVARFELEFLRAFPDEVKEIAAQAEGRPRSEPSIDEDRLWSALIRERDTLLERSEADSLLVTIDVATRPLCNAHRQFPPRDVTLAERNARHNPVENLHLLLGYSKVAKAAGLLDVSLEADRALTRVILRQRMMSENWLIPPAVSASDQPYDVWLDGVTRALHMSGDLLQPRVAALIDYEQPETREGTWPHVESRLLSLDLAQLRDNTTVSTLSQETAKAFTAIGDAKGVFLCHVIEASWRARKGKPLSAVIQRMTDTEIPDCNWDQISLAARDDDPAFLDALRPDWRPWIARALAVFARSARPSKAQHPERIVKWLVENHACEVGDQRVLPLEEAFLQRTPGLAESIGNMIGIAIAGAILLAAGSAYWWWLWRATGGRWFALRPGISWHNVWTISLHALAVLFLTVLFLVLISGFAALVQWLTRRFTSLSGIASPFVAEYNFQVALDADPNRPLSTAFSVKVVTRYFYWRQSSSITFGLQAITDGRYFVYRDGPLGTDAMRTTLRVLQVLKLRPEFRVSVDAASAGGNWEALLATKSGDTAHFADVVPRFSRTVSGRSLLAQPNWESPVGFITWTYRGLGLERSTFSSRKTFGSKTRRYGAEVLTRPSEFEQVRYRTGIAHLFGSPVERSSEVFLGVGGDESGAVPYWISPPEIQRRYPSLRLLVVQAPPTDVRERTSSDRLIAAQLKRFGARAFECGIPAVLVLPSLPLALGNAASSILLEELRSNARNAAHRLTTLTRRLQELVGASPHDSPDVPYELALDICLYVEERVNFRVRPEEATSSKAELGAQK